MRTSIAMLLWLVCAAQAGVFDPDIRGTGLSLQDYMLAVTGGGEPNGPAYTFSMGKYEITNAQFCAFLNDAESDSLSGAPTAKSSYMFFGPDGTVYLDSAKSKGEIMFRPHQSATSSDIRYDPSSLPGRRYSVVTDMYGNDKSAFPARRLSWLGAAKFCNWLTLDQGLGEAHRCYTEGPDIGDWHPVTITTADWWGKEPVHEDDISAGRTLNDAERIDLVRNYKGYRLPMDNAPLLSTNNRPNPSPYNEWLKAASWDPNAPTTWRTNAGGWSASPGHWMYGTGRETNTAADANWRYSNDPWEYDDGTTPVDYYDGTDHGGTFLTNDTSNRYGFYGMSGNIWEYSQSYGLTMEARAVYGGSWVSTAERQAAASCYYYSPVNFPDVSFGLRILQVSCPLELKVTASDAEPQDEFGRTLAIDANRLVSTAHFEDTAGNNAGAVYVYTQDGLSWIEQGILTAGDPDPGDRFGDAVDIDGDRILVGVPFSDDAGSESGSAYLFEYDGATWNQIAKFTASDAGSGDRFGCAVAISGDTAFVGAYSDDGLGSAAGAVYVFEAGQTGWAQVDKLLASDGSAGDYFGSALSADGTNLLVGAYGDDDTANDCGSVYAFQHDGLNWVEVDKLNALDPEATDGFGFSVSVDGDLAVIGTPWSDDAGSLSGSAYVFARSGSNWSQQARLTADDAGTEHLFGHAVGISGTRVVVGAFGHDSLGNNSGQAYVFEGSSGSWSQQMQLAASDLADDDQYGQAVGISGALVAVGSPYDSDGGFHAGSAYVYELDPTCYDTSVIRVCQDGTGDYQTIQSAIDAATPGDEIVVCEGIYTGAGNKNLDFQGKAITLRSEGDPKKTIIDCEGDGRAFYFHSGETTATVLRGFTIMNGSVAGSAEDGGAILCINSSPLITECRFINNTALFGAAIACENSNLHLRLSSFYGNVCDGGSGGGISCLANSNAIIEYCDFRGNWGVSGGGVRFYESDPTISHSMISGNHGNTGGGVYCNRSEAVIQHCTIVGNTSNGGAGIYCYLKSPTILNSTIAGNKTLFSAGGIYASNNSPIIAGCNVAGNSAGTGGGLRTYLANPSAINCNISRNSASTGPDVATDDSQLDIANSIIWGNGANAITSNGTGGVTVTYSDVENGWPGEGNLDTDPLFVDGPTGTWTSNGVYDDASKVITLTDTAADWSSNQWLGKLINPDTSQPLQLYILGNTPTTITILADRATIEAAASWVSSGATYEIRDYHLTSTFPIPGTVSPCVNAGRTSELPPDMTDLDNDSNTDELMPVELDGSARVSACVVDMGPFELVYALPVTIPGDFDRDCDVDANDTAAFEACASGPEIAQSDPDCGGAKLDADADVDHLDFSLLQRCFTGADQFGDPDCLDD